MKTMGIMREGQHQFLPVLLVPLLGLCTHVWMLISCLSLWRFSSWRASKIWTPQVFMSSLTPSARMQKILAVRMCQGEWTRCSESQSKELESCHWDGSTGDLQLFTEGVVRRHPVWSVFMFSSMINYHEFSQIKSYNYYFRFSHLKSYKSKGGCGNLQFAAKIVADVGALRPAGCRAV